MGAAFAQLEGNVTKSAARSRFKRYGPGKRKKTAKADIREDEVLKLLVENFKGFEMDERDDGDYGDDIYHNYCRVLEILKGLRYSAKDVERFSLALGRIEEQGEILCHRAGIFLSALVNEGIEEDYVIHTAHLQEIWEVGLYNRKNITILGDMSVAIGSWMEAGCLVLKGDIRDISGEVDGTAGLDMDGGKIIVEGSVRCVGNHMYGGEVIVTGDVLDEVGWGMSGGIIRIGGNISWVSDQMKGGKIYHKGKLIVDK